MRPVLNRRDLLRSSASTGLGVMLTGCERLAGSERVNHVLSGADLLNKSVQETIAGATLAKEYPASAISSDFRANGSTSPDDEIYQAHATSGFTDWRLDIGGLVKQPLSLSLADLRRSPGRNQITRHDCVEGWSSIAGWQGARLGPLLDRAGLKHNARYLAFFCADSLELTLDDSGSYYETIGIADAYHPQTILAYEMNGRPLPIANGAPIRLRLERQLGYKMAKYVMRIEAIESFAHLGLGKGGYWEDRGYQWYAGI